MKKYRIHFLEATKDNKFYHRACDLNCHWPANREGWSVIPKSVTCKNCKRTAIFKRALKRNQL